MKEEKKDKRQGVFLAVISLLTLFFAVVGTSFAYFTIIVRGNENASSVLIKSVKLGQVVFEDGQEISLLHIYPGDYATKTFTIKNTGSDDTLPIRYSVYLVQSTNEFASNNIVDFKHEIIASSKDSESDESVLGILPSTTVPSPASTAPIFSGVLYGNDTHSYTYKIGLIESNSNQNLAQGLTFLGKIQVEVDDSVKYTSGGTIWSSQE